MHYREFLTRLYLFDSNKSYGSHKNRAFKDESHKGSMDSLNGEEKKDASKEDLEQEEGTSVNRIFKNLIKLQHSDGSRKIARNLIRRFVSR